MRDFSSSWMGNVRWSMVALLLAAFAVRLYWFFPFPNIPPLMDQGVFLKQGRAVWKNGLVEWKYDERAPGYILFLAANFQLTNSDSRSVVRVTQSLLSVTTGAIVFALTRLAFASLSKRRREQVALLAAILSAFSPDYIFYSQLLWSETFFVFLVTLGLACLLRGYHSRKDWRWFLASGIILGAALLTREVLLAFVVFFLPLWLWLVLNLAPLQRARIILVVMVGICALLVPWTLRNLMQGNGLELVSWQGGRDFLTYNARMMRPGSVKKRLAAMNAEPTGQAKNAFAYREGLLVILNNPAKWVLVKSYNTAGLWRTVRSVALSTAGQLGLISHAVQKSFRLYLDGFGVLCVLFTIVGFVYSRDARVTLLFAFFLLAAVLAFFAIHYIARFRLGLSAPLFPLTAYGIFTLGAGLRSFISTREILDWRRLALTVLLILLLGATYPSALRIQLG